MPRPWLDAVDAARVGRSLALVLGPRCRQAPGPAGGLAGSAGGCHRLRRCRLGQCARAGAWLAHPGDASLVHRLLRLLGPAAGSAGGRQPRRDPWLVQWIVAAVAAAGGSAGGPVRVAASGAAATERYRRGTAGGEQPHDRHLHDRHALAARSARLCPCAGGHGGGSLPNRSSAHPVAQQRTAARSRRHRPGTLQLGPG